jgi:hypothetical protein
MRKLLKRMSLGQPSRWKSMFNMSDIARALGVRPATARKYAANAIEWSLVDQSPNAHLRSDLGAEDKGPLGNMYVISERGLDFLRIFGDYDETKPTQREDGRAVSIELTEREMAFFREKEAAKKPERGTESKRLKKQ